MVAVEPGARSVWSVLTDRSVSSGRGDFNPCELTIDSDTTLPLPSVAGDDPTFGARLVG
jgi:hypothetical protein